MAELPEPPAPISAGAQRVPPGPLAGLLPREFFAASALEVAPALVGMWLVRSDGRAARLVEVEAYMGADDPGSHAYKGKTRRNATMFGPPGRLYVYFTYGMHWCANVVCSPEGTASAVLLRAAEPTAGVDLMRRSRWQGQRQQRDRDLCRGPARLCQAFDITGAYDGADLVNGDRGVWLAVGTSRSTRPVGTSERVGLSSGAELPWRFFEVGSMWVS
ncbi:MAG: DNA-3-methyladenine glycosylase [Acidimicrobiales bacterium]